METATSSTGDRIMTHVTNLDDQVVEQGQEGNYPNYSPLSYGKAMFLC